MSQANKHPKQTDADQPEASTPDISGGHKLPLRLTHSEEGHPLPAPIKGLKQQIIGEEVDEELIINE